MIVRQVVSACWVGVLGLAVAVQPAASQSAPLQDLEAYIEQGMRDWEIPGLAIAVIRGDSVVFSQGYGVRELGSPEPVDVHTIFAIGSASKSFTSAAVAMLVDEGEVAWDDAATLHLPELQLHDPYASRELTVSDLLTHRSGLSRGDLVWYATDFDRDEILRRTRFLEPSWSFRSQFGYQNIMYLAAGQIIPAVTGQSWDDFVHERIFDPLGMAVSSTSTHALEAMDNVASPHAEIDDELRPVPWRNIDNIGPAGSINSNVYEMAGWVKMQLGQGEFGGGQLLSEEKIAEMHTPETLVRIEGGWAAMAPESHFMAYGLGWFLNDHQGRKVIQHGGNIDGMHALVGMMPEEDVGLVILTNRNPNSLTYAVMYRVFDAYLGVAETDWSARLIARRDSLQQREEERRQEVEESRVTGTRPSLEMESLTGTYRHPMYGDVTVSLEDGGAVVRRGPNFIGDLDHWHYDTFRASWRDPVLGRSFLSFSLSPQAEVSELHVEGLGEFSKVEEEDAVAVD